VGAGRLRAVTSPPPGERLLAHTRTGEGPRPVVLLHGFLGSARNLASLARRLAQAEPATTVVSVDLPGHGASPPLPPGADLATLAADVLASARALGLESPLLLVGHSLGGRVALQAAAHAAGAVAAVTLLDISPSPSRRGGEVERVLDALAGAPAEAATRDVFRASLRAGGLADPMAEWLLTNLEAAPGGLRWRFDRAALAALHDRTRREDLWEAVEDPRPYVVRCLRGAASGYVTDADAARLGAAGCPVATIAGAGHFLHVDRPDEVLAHLRAHVASPGAPT
jgi:esterase